MSRRLGAISLSLATLCMLKVWRELLDAPWDFVRIAPPGRVHYILAILITLVFALIFLVAWRLAGRLGLATENVGKFVFLCLCFAAVGIVRNSFGVLQFSTDPMLQSIPTTALALSLPVALGLCIIFLRPLTQAAAVCLLIVSPIAAIVLGRGIWRTITPRRIVQAPFKAELPQTSPASRFIWIIFDEMDQHFAFAERPPGLLLPELDSFRKTALYATNATAPATQTHYSMPALITGRAIKRATIPGANDLLLTTDSQPDTARFSDLDNVFREAHRRGFRTGVVGNYIPYCRILNSDLDYCSDHLLGVEAGSGVTLDDAFSEQIQSLLNSLPFHDRLPSLSIGTKKHAAVYRDVLADAKTAAADRRLNLLLIHFPIPHLPPVFGSSYVDNLRLVDESLKELRQAMENAGLWQTSNILITADHGFRGRPGFDNCVPFLLKLSGQTERTEYTQPFNTIVTRDLILSILSGNLLNPLTFH